MAVGRVQAATGGQRQALHERAEHGIDAELVAGGTDQRGRQARRAEDGRDADGESEQRERDAQQRRRQRLGVEQRRQRCADEPEQQRPSSQRAGTAQHDRPPGA